MGLEGSHRLWKHRNTCALWCSIIMLPWLHLNEKGTAIATVVIRDVFTHSLSGCRVGFLFPGAGRFQGRGEVRANISWVKVNDGAVDKHLWLNLSVRFDPLSTQKLKGLLLLLTNTRTVSENKLQQMREELLTVQSTFGHYCESQRRLSGPFCFSLCSLGLFLLCSTF